MKEVSLVIMAAGIGSRFGGGVKQLAKVGPNGEVIMEYSIYDAIKAGFNKVVFIIRPELKEELHELVGKKIENLVKVEYVFQSLDDIPKGYTLPEGRTKPLGTGHAILAARNSINGPFAVINADDYYGTHGFKVLFDFLNKEEEQNQDFLNMAMAGFVLKNTLSDNGSVTRGVCKVENGKLVTVEETFEIYKTSKGAESRYEKPYRELDVNSIVSMNMWGLPKNFVPYLQKGFEEFLGSLKRDDIKKEYLLPAVIDTLVKEKKGQVDVLKTDDTWFGVTYREDKEIVEKALKKLHNDGVYPSKLF